MYAWKCISWLKQASLRKSIVLRQIECVEHKSSDQVWACFNSSFVVTSHAARDPCRRLPDPYQFPVRNQVSPLLGVLPLKTLIYSPLLVNSLSRTPVS
jgi:hypothetical protein